MGVVDSFSRLIGCDGTSASDAVIETAEEILERAGKVDEYVGIHITNTESEAAAWSNPESRRRTTSVTSR